MSGCTGASRVLSRCDYECVVESFIASISPFKRIVGVFPTGSYRSDSKKTSFGDIDLIVEMEGYTNKKEAKQDLINFLITLPNITKFSSVKYNGKLYLNAGELVSIRYFTPNLNESFQIDNIVSLSSKETEFKQNFLDLPADKQGLLIGLVRVALIELSDIDSLFNELGIKIEIDSEYEYEFNISSSSIQLRKIKYVSGSYTESAREILWQSNEFSLIKMILPCYSFSESFDFLLNQCKNNIKFDRSKNRIIGLFLSMVTIKSGELGTEKGQSKQSSIDKVKHLFDNG